MEDVAQTVLNGLAEDVAEFPLFLAILAWLIPSAVMWSFVELLKVSVGAKLKRPPPAHASESTVVRYIVRQAPWYPIVIWGVSLFGGAAIGFGIGAIDGFAPGDLGWWGLVAGSLAVLNGVWTRLLRSGFDKASDLFWGWAKRRLGAKED